MDGFYAAPRYPEQVRAAAQQQWTPGSRYCDGARIKLLLAARNSLIVCYQRMQAGPTGLQHRLMETVDYSVVLLQHHQLPRSSRTYSSLCFAGPLVQSPAS